MKKLAIERKLEPLSQNMHLSVWPPKAFVLDLKMEDLRFAPQKSPLLSSNLFAFLKSM